MELTACPKCDSPNIAWSRPVAWAYIPGAGLFNAMGILVALYGLAEGGWEIALGMLAGLTCVSWGRRLLLSWHHGRWICPDCDRVWEVNIKTGQVRVEKDNESEGLSNG